jgi:DNA helicase-2/ATP-dependent DNA helicase PcrA
MDEIFKDLNDKQCEAVKEINGRIKIVAGAGSGKTRVLTNRFGYLVNYIGVSPSNILCMTFTNKAAQEMKNRIAKIVTSTGDLNDFVCTIHGFCVKVLRREIHRLGFPSSFIIIDKEDSKAFAKQVMEELNIQNVTVKQFLANIYETKMLSGSDYVQYMLPNQDLDSKNSFMRYLQLQVKYYSLDFFDIVSFTLYIFENFHDALQYWQEKFDYVMVDEVQDCSNTDWRIINYVCGKNNNLFIVGDPDQAIYEWRGSLPRFFIEYKADKQIILNRNYRSTPNILDVANSIISHNKNRIPKDLFTAASPSNIVLHYHGKSETEEAEWVAKQIESLRKTGFAEYDDIAILYRASYISRPFEQSLVKEKIPYVMWGGIRFFERKEIKDAIAYLRLVANKDDMSFKRIINVPSRKFGNVTLKKLVAIADNEHKNFYDTLCTHFDDKDFSKESYRNFYELIEKYRGLKDTISISELLEGLLKDSGLKDELRLDDDQDRLDNINELINSIKYYEDSHKEDDYDLNSYLQDVALYTNADYKQDSRRVRIMTIHQAKGLEFKYVFVVGLSEGVFPSHRSIRERKKAAEEEERRLMYVALTRAEKALFLTESEGFCSATHSNKYPSRFFNEIKESLIKVEGNMDPELLKGTNSLVELIGREINPLVSENTFSVGETVEHNVLGQGVIIYIDAEKGFCYVDFGDKRINLRSSILRKIKN